MSNVALMRGQIGNVVFSIFIVKVKDSKTNLFVCHLQRSLAAGGFQSSEVNDTYMFLLFASNTFVPI